MKQSYSKDEKNENFTSPEYLEAVFYINLPPYMATIKHR